ncbi:AhpC/TSA family protein [Zhouia spongiae]|uniref:AhpC/TSA family protein n=1 Tax=Zhouia spongiae TaxID=2202721 RepID=A0ABY3YLJ9_9FLAO|nr:TlpA disulfide reductase family protein [Zhouia spongiae]UNY98573.1 AhpC/TSA family protein [Zhouia spongiae]
MKLVNSFLVFLLLIGCKTEHPLKPDTYRINGTVTGLSDGEIYLPGESGIDTIMIRDGSFIIEKEIKEPVLRIGILKDANMRGITDDSYLSLFAEPAIMKLQLDYNNFKNSTLKGSKTQDDEYKLDSIRNHIAADYKKEQGALKAMNEKYRKASDSGADKEELEAISYEINDLKEALTPMFDTQNKATMQFVKNHPDSFISMYSLFFMLSDLTYDEAKPLYDSFTAKYRSTTFGKQLEEEVENLKKGAPGSLAADFSTTDINGDPLKLSDFKGKYLLIDFWASWCVPCRKGNPHLISLYKKYNDKGLEILGVSDDDSDPDKWRKAVEKDGIGIWHHVLRGLKIDRTEGKYKVLDGGISDAYGIHTLPTKILVNPNGTIVGRYGGGGGTDEDMDRDLAALFD